MTLEVILGRWAPTFLLLLVRCSGVAAFAPVFSGATVPAVMRAGLAGGLALVLTPLMMDRGLRLPSDGLGLTVTLLGELAIGAVLGLAVRFLFAGISMAGDVAAVQMGVGLPAALNPLSMIQSTSVSNLIDQIAILTFLAVGGHHTVLAALAQSLTLAPPLSVKFDGGTMEYLVGMFQAALVLAIRLAAPVGAAMLVSMVALGILARVAPQLNVFMLAFALSIGVGVLVLLAALPVLSAVMSHSFLELPANLTSLLGRMRHGL